MTDTGTGITGSRRRRGLAVVFFVVFLDLLGFGIIIPILPYYTRTFPGGTEFVIGLLAASYSAMQFVFAPLLGSLSDRVGRRPVLVVSLCGSVVAWTVFGLADALWLLFLSRMLAGAMGGNLSTAQAYVADVTPPERRAAALGFIGAAFGLGFIFGPGIGAVLSFDATVTAVDGLLPAAVPITRFSLPSFAAAAASLGGVFVALLFLPESRRASTSTDTTERTSAVTQLRTAVATPGLRPLLVAFFLVSFAFSGVQVMFVPYVADIYGYTAAQSALLLTYIGVVAVITQGVLVGRLSARYSPVRLSVFGTGLLVVGVGAIPISRPIGSVLPDLTNLVPFLTADLLGLLLVLTVLPLGNGILSVTLTALVSQQASAALQGSAFGVTQGAGSLARTVGPPVMGGLYFAVGYWSPFVVGSVLLLPVLWLVARLGATPESYEPRPADPR
ncbi:MULTISPECIES: MFS transporter [Haloarcula]|uniref:Major facilitator superfamily MFS1 n=1 Tax=Haloarcula amylolytica JCM 13557 TaxID=1227452 RepID=M0L1L8_9EURY|nr:tetracycline resistance MFS efflux pump [Haloarcula amylolytica]EMA25900.1 major facilitator superfamily MFS1 [Haloarcula amylolytica JCM 13557]